MQRHPRAFLQDERARVWGQLPRQDPQQRRLAGTVASRQRHPLPWLELEGDVGEQQLAAEVNVQSCRSRDRHRGRTNLVDHRGHITSRDAWPSRTCRRAGEGASDAALLRTRRQPGAGRAGSATAGAAGRLGGRMAWRLRIPAHLRWAHAVHRPLPLSSPVPRTCSCAGPRSRPRRAGSLRRCSGGDGRRPRRPHPLRPRGRRAGDRSALRLQGLRIQLPGHPDGPSRPRRARRRGRALPHL